MIATYQPLCCLKDQHFRAMRWTSLNHKGYVTYTAHFIDARTWQFYAMVRGLYERNGGSKHEDSIVIVNTN